MDDMSSSSDEEEQQQQEDSKSVASSNADSLFGEMVLSKSQGKAKAKRTKA